MNAKTIITSSLTAFALLMGFYLLMPLGIDRIEGGELGSTITTINGSDKVKDSRSVINSNFANLNADKLEISAFNATTSLPQITTLSNLSSIGTINSGTWHGSTLTVAYGGTGSTTLVQNALLMGNGTSGILAVPKGSDGQVLGLSSGVPTWQSATVDETLAYDWTGFNTFTSAYLASTTIGASVVQTPTASSSIASKGYVDSSVKDVYEIASSSELQASADTERLFSGNTSYTVTIKEIKVREIGTLVARWEMKNSSGGNNVGSRLYVNDIAVGTEKGNTTSTYIEFSEVIPVEHGDLVQLRTYDSSFNDGYIRNFRLYWTKSKVNNYTVNTD